MSLRACFLCLLALTVSAVWAQDGVQASVDATTAVNTPALANVRIDQLLGAQIPMTAAFKDWNRTPVTMGSLLGKRPAILVPIFYNCTGVCNLELQNLLTSIPEMKDRQLGKDYDVIIVSINPTETPTLAAAKRKNVLNSVSLPGTESGWHLLTGTLPNIRSVTDAVGFRYTYDVEKNVVNHPSGIMILSPTGRVSSYLYGASYPVPTLRKDIDTAAKNQLAAKAEEIFFGCVHVDPITGRRSIVIENVMRVMGVATVLVVLCSLLTLSGKKLFRS